MEENKKRKTNNSNPRKHIGEVHGIYTIIDVLDKKDKYRHYIYVGKCNECGYIKYSHYGGFSGKGQVAYSCKHLRVGTNIFIPQINWNNHRIAHIFAGIKQRCYNSKDKGYKWYGAKGIKMCDEWINNPKLFEEWSLQNGYDDNLTIDRIDENKDYSPDNCQWILLEDNSRRAGKVNWITINGETLTGKQWSSKLNLGINTINNAIRKYGIEKTKELIVAMLQELPSTKHRKSHQTWFSVYGIQV